MPDFAKGCLFVGAAVTVGMLVGFAVPMFVDPGTERAATIASRKPVLPPQPVMPDLTGQKLDDAEQTLDSRRIDHETIGGVLGLVVPSVFEVCETEPAPGQQVHGTAYLYVELPGSCT
jgi:PASTA domain